MTDSDVKSTPPGRNLLSDFHVVDVDDDDARSEDDGLVFRRMG